MKSTSMFVALLFAAIMAVSTQAACGGGGYHPATTTSYRPAQTTTTTTEYRQESRVSGDSFDTSRFNNISGRLHLSYDQATKVIATMNEIRAKAGSQPKDAPKDKKYDAQKDFDDRLSKILDEKQYKDYLAYSKQG